MILPLRLTRKMREKLQTVEPYVGEILVLTGGLMYAEAIAHDDENAKIWMSDNIDTMFAEEYEYVTEEIEDHEIDIIRQGFADGFEMSKKLGEEIANTYDFSIKGSDGVGWPLAGIRLIDFDEAKNIIIVEVD